LTNLARENSNKFESKADEFDNNIWRNNKAIVTPSAEETRLYFKVEAFTKRRLKNHIIIEPKNLENHTHTLIWLHG